MRCGEPTLILSGVPRMMTAGELLERLGAGDRGAGLTRVVHREVGPDQQAVGVVSLGIEQRMPDAGGQAADGEMFQLDRFMR